MLPARRVAVLSVLSALCVGLQLIPRPPNVEFTSLFCFVTGFLFGGLFGALLGILVMTTNSFLSPWGLAGLNLPFQTAGMVIIGSAGGIYRQTLQSERFSSIHLIELPILAASLTLLYDLITNIGFALIAEVNLMVVLVMGTWFTVVHVAWNAFLFTASFVPLVETVKKVWNGGAKP